MVSRARPFRQRKSEVVGYDHLLRRLEPGPGSVGGGRLHGTSPGFGHQPGRFQPRDPFPVGSRPDASPAARGEPNHGALAVDPTGPAVDPAEAESFLDRSLVGDRRPTSSRLPADEPGAPALSALEVDPGFLLHCVSIGTLWPPCQAPGGISPRADRRAWRGAATRAERTFLPPSRV